MNVKNVFSTFILSVFVTMPAIAGDSHKPFTEILSEHVKDGLVNYKALCEDKKLEQYIEQLANTNPDTMASKEAQLAFWINAYNAYTLKVICDNYPVKSINDLHFGGLIIGTVLKKTIWDADFVIINKKRLSLNTIEHKIIRPKFKDARIQFALVCAAISCPELRAEAYEGEKLDEQLNDQARKFLANPKDNSFDTDKKVAYLSKIIDWYAGDFGDNDAEILLYLAQFLPADIADDIKANPNAWKIKHNSYDWSLNEQKTQQFRANK